MSETTRNLFKIGNILPITNIQRYYEFISQGQS